MVPKAFERAAVTRLNAANSTRLKKLPCYSSLLQYSDAQRPKLQVVI